MNSVSNSINCTSSALIRTSVSLKKKKKRIWYSVGTGGDWGIVDKLNRLCLSLIHFIVLILKHEPLLL